MQLNDVECLMQFPDITWDTLPLPVKTNVKGPIEGGIMPNAISYPASRIPCLILKFRV